MLNHVNHEAAHYMIQALSLTEAGSDLVKALEDIRYYHKAADVYDLGYGGILVEAFDMDSDGDCYWEGSVLIPSQRDRLTYESAAHQDEPVQGAQKAGEADVARRDTTYDFPSLIMPGYLQLCPTVYGVNLNRIDCLDVWPTPFEDCTPETICDEKSWSYREPVVLRAACQIMSDLKHWEYFDKCSPLQCAKHLFANDFRPVDL